MLGARNVVSIEPMDNLITCCSISVQHEWREERKKIPFNVCFSNWKTHPKSSPNYPQMPYSSDKLHQVGVGCAILPVRSHRTANQEAGMRHGGNDVSVSLRQPGPSFFLMCCCLSVCVCVYHPATLFPPSFSPFPPPPSQGEGASEGRGPKLMPPARSSLARGAVGGVCHFKSLCVWRLAAPAPKGRWPPRQRQQQQGWKVSWRHSVM